ncbi:hypothetical protein Metbo_2011 [Methanobacterium lacus]|jgi:hypothetical protein|uniref:Uncharacterized protein n=1 Tax=Methanobacterium lacus (strain AL-21) TaxID=877455 RepID=F0TBG1_METLA|nr:hypothetical protein Metbo_2011 [Methanobacterium lacus]
MSTSAIVAIIAVTIMVVYILVKYWRLYNKSKPK